MRRGRDFLGLMVYQGDRQEPVGEVQDVVVDATGRITGLIVSPLKGLFRKERQFPFGAFESVSSLGARLQSSEPLHNAEKTVEPGIRLFCHEDALCGRMLVDEKGEELGMIGDAVFDDDPLRIWGFEVSDGIFRDLLDGRPVVEAAGATLEGEQVILKSHSHAHMNLLPDGHPMK